MPYHRTTPAPIGDSRTWTVEDPPMTLDDPVHLTRHERFGPEGAR